MKADTILDYALFQLSPKHSRCDLFVSSNGETEKLASGLIEPFVNHFKVLEAQSAKGVQSSIKVEIDKSEDDKNWFTRRTLERFVQFVNSPEILDKVITFDSEMSQLEAARTLYSQGSDSGRTRDSDNGGAADATKKELLRAIDVRLEAIKKDLTTAIAQASATGFDSETVSDLQHFADRFGANQLDEACSTYISIWRRRPDLITKNLNNSNIVGQSEIESSKSIKNDEEEKRDKSLDESSMVKPRQLTRGLSVQERINLFESKQKENENSGGKPVIAAKSTELRRLSSDVSSAPAVSEKSVLKRWSIVSDMSIDLSVDKKLEDEGPSDTQLATPDATVTKESHENDECFSKSELISDSQTLSDEEGFQQMVKSSISDVEMNMNSELGVVSEGQFRSVMTDADPMQTEESSASKSHNVAQSSAMFPNRHSRSRSANITGGIDIKTEPQLRSSAGKSRKKEMVPGTISQKPISAGAQRQKPFGVEGDLDDGEVKQVSLVTDDSVGKVNSTRVRAASVDRVQRTRLSRESPRVNNELKTKDNELEKMFAEHKIRVPGDKSGFSRCSKPNGTIVPKQEVPKGNGNGEVLRRNFSDLSFSDESKGKLYEKYMKKRDAKLREELSSKKSEKETKLKSMQDALERGRTEMKTKFSAASEKQDSISSSRQRAEKFRSFNSRSSLKKYQHPISSFQSEEDEDLSELFDQKTRFKDEPINGQSIGNSASRSSQARKLPPNRSISSITSKTGSPASKLSAKVSNTNTSGKRRTESQIAQSIANFSDLRKENTKSSSLAVKTSLMRPQMKSNGHGKVLKEDSSASDVSENLKTEEYEELDHEVDEIVENSFKEKEATDSGNGKAENSEDEDCNLIQVDPSSVTELPVKLPATFHSTIASLMESSPSESPLSWNSSLQHTFSYQHEQYSDADASMDSPMGSPASCSSRMRKKWGSTQNPVIGSHQQLQSRKDLAKGIKRLLKFGRKTRGAESLMDWASVTTSEGDDDQAYRSSDELRKSRMASSQTQFSEDGLFNKSMVPAHNHHHHDEEGSIKVKDEFRKSFFSLSTFRSKGNESKPR